MATRRAHPYQFDHGAQFFRTQSSAFQDYLAPMLADGVIQPWQARFVEFNHKEITSSRAWDLSFPHYVGVPTMSAVPRYLSQELDIRLNTRVGSMSRAAGKWQLTSDSGQDLGAYDWLISTAPSQQSQDLLADLLPARSQPHFRAMKACFSLMLGFARPLALDFDAALVRGQDISWVSVNSSKPGRDSSSTCLLVHSTNNWADRHIDDDREQVLSYLCAQTSELIGQDASQAEHKAVHGWRYANIGKQHGSSYHLDADHKLGLCGDWFIQGRVESAYTSGRGLAQGILSELQ